MHPYLKLIRYPNLVIIVLTQYLMRWGIIDPMLEVNHFELQMDAFHFFLLVLSTVTITAGGYVINDYFDTHTDLLNKPRQVLVGTTIHRRFAMILHIILNVFGVGLGFYISFHVGIPYLGFVFLLVVGLLWFYSTTYKRQFLVGNLMVALLTAIVPLMVPIFEIPLLNAAYRQVMIENQMNFMYILYWVLAFSFFAFLTNFIREIIKDMEDFEGDRVYGRKSLPVVLGTKTTKLVVHVLLLATLTGLIFAWFEYLGDTITLVYFLLFLWLPLLFLIFKTIKADDKQDFHLISQILKIVMLFGVLYALVARYIIQTQLL